MIADVSTAPERRFLLKAAREVFLEIETGELPEFGARTVDFKHRVEISYLGRTLLREIGLPTSFDAQSDA